MAKNNSISQETQLDAERVAKATQRPGQTKAQTKLIAQGIEKGIAQYKKEQKAKARERDKERKKSLKARQKVEDVHFAEAPSEPEKAPKLPWILLLLSWVGFALYISLVQS